MKGRSHLKACAAVCMLVAFSMLTLSCSSGDPSGPEWPVVMTVTDVQHHIGDNPGNEGQSWFGSFKVSVAFSQAEVSVKFLYPNSLGVSGPEVDRPPQILVNGEEQQAELFPGHYAVILREWQNGDQVRLAFSPAIVLEKWEKIGNAVSVRRGPLWFSLKIGEEWKRYGGSNAWPAYEILPTTPWNYGLVVEPSQPEGSISLVTQKEPAYQPFDLEAAPMVLRARARRIPDWKAEGKMVGKMPPGPAVSSEPVEDITLIPMGCARLRLSVFPLVKPPV